MRKSLKSDEKLDPLLVNTNLNTRLKVAWENLTNDERDAFMIKEEEDRRRFMEEDEIASRHCATLTARGKSPRTTEKADKFNTKNEEREETDTSQLPSSAPEDGADSKNNSLNGKREHDKIVTEKKSESDVIDEHSDESLPNRAASPSENSQGASFESPTKRNRQSQDTSTS